MSCHHTVYHIECPQGSGSMGAYRVGTIICGWLMTNPTCIKSASVWSTKHGVITDGQRAQCPSRSIDDSCKIQKKKNIKQTCKTAGGSINIIYIYLECNEYNITIIYVLHYTRSLYMRVHSEINNRLFRQDICLCYANAASVMPMSLQILV
jgi:hypothetical protein